jgi:predicted  nucleic acid-binding Zn-ribbon protein
MAATAVILREVHRLRRHAKDLQTQIDRTPVLRKAQQAKATRQEEAVREAQEALKKLKVTTHDKESQLKATFQVIAKHEKQLNEAANKKEYDALKHEIADEKAKCQRLEDEILNGMTEIEEKTAQLPELEKAVQRAKEELARWEQDVEARQAGQAAQLQEAQQQLKAVEGSLPEDVRVQYERLLALRGEDALSAVEGRTCTACYTEITHQSYNDLLSGRLVTCKACGRMLYLPE